MECRVVEGGGRVFTYLLMFHDSLLRVQKRSFFILLYAKRTFNRDLPVTFSAVEKVLML